MIHNIFIGVDGGGTKTKIRIEDQSGRLLGKARGGPAQINISVEQAWDSINTTFFQIMQELGIDPAASDYRFHAGLALAGTEIKRCYDKFLQAPSPFNSICLRSDAYAACVGAHAGNDGAIIIAGTGTKGYQIAGGVTSEVGGWGFPHGDEGGGDTIGLHALRLTLHNIDGRLPDSPLFSAIFSTFDNNLEALLDWTVGATATKYATLAPLVIEYVEKNDPYALRIIKRAAKAVDEIGYALDTKKGDQSKILPCALFGGIAPFIKPWLGEALQERIVERKYSATEGAIMMIREYVQEKGLLE